MKKEEFTILKASGERARFSMPKLKHSLRRSGADEQTISQIIDVVRDELYDGISTKEIYNRAYVLLKKNKSIYASKYKLKKAIYELGPTGFPFERFVAAILEYSGYRVEVGQILQGKCVRHEIDVIAKRNEQHIIIECKFHSDRKNKCDVKIPLYIHSRYRDVVANYGNGNNCPNEGWVVTNTQFTKDAITYGKCSGLQLLSWDFPKGNGLKDRIDRLGLYPITVSTLMTGREKQFLLSREVVLCRQLLNDVFYLDHLGISEKRKSNIMKEIKMLCG